MLIRRLAVLATLAGALILPLAIVGPARADLVRRKDLVVLNTIGVPAAWHVTQGKGVLVAVIDSGVDPSVSDLAGSVVSGPDYTGVRTPESNPNWGAHGTWMASLIAGHGNGKGNVNGIVGVAPQAKILAIRVITDRHDPGYAAYQRQAPARGQGELAKAIKYAVRHGAGVISMSLGYVAPSLVVRSALQDAVRHNVVVVASSGNAGTAQTAVGSGHAPYSFPADYPGVVGVAAINESGMPAYFSSSNLSVQVAAPGVNVPAQGRGSHFWLVTGTSPACALTAGVAALIRARYPKLTAVQVRRAITSSAVNRPPRGYDEQVGFGTLNAARALAAARRLARHAAVVPSAALSQAGRFGSGPIPSVPVTSPGKRKLLELAALGAFCLLVLLVSTWRFATGMVGRKARRAAPIGVAAAPVMAGGPATSFAGPVTNAGFPAGVPRGQPAPGTPWQAGVPELPNQPGPPAGPGRAPLVQPGQGTAGPAALANLSAQAGPGYPWQSGAGAGGASWPGAGATPPAPPAPQVPPAPPAPQVPSVPRIPQVPSVPQVPPAPVGVGELPTSPAAGFAAPPFPGQQSWPDARFAPQLPPEERPWPGAGSALPASPGQRDELAVSGPGPASRESTGQPGPAEASSDQQADIAGPVLSWLDRTYPASRPAGPPSPAPQSLPRRQRPEGSQPVRPSAFWATASASSPMPPRAGSDVGPPRIPGEQPPGAAAPTMAGRTRPRPQPAAPASTVSDNTVSGSTGSGSTGSDSTVSDSRGSDSTGSDSRGSASSGDFVWKAWSPTETTDRAGGPEGSDPHGDPA